MLTSIELVRNFREVYPTSTATEISKVAGLSRERIRQLLNKLELPTNFRQKHSCSSCTKMIPMLKTYCSRKCVYDAYHVTLSCGYCKQNFDLARAEYNERFSRSKYKVFYCSRPCRYKMSYFHQLNVGKQRINYNNRRLQSIGSSRGFTIGKKILRELNWEKEGDRFTIRKIGEKIVILKNP